MRHWSLNVKLLLALGWWLTLAFAEPIGRQAALLSGIGLFLRLMAGRLKMFQTAAIVALAWLPMFALIPWQDAWRYDLDAGVRLAHSLLIAVGIVWSSQAIALTTARNDGLSRLGRLGPIGTAFGLTLHQLSDARAELVRIWRAAWLRGFKLRVRRRALGQLADLTGSWLVASHGRAERWGQALALRGFEGQFHDFRPTATDRRAWLWVAAWWAVGIMFVLI